MALNKASLRARIGAHTSLPYFQLNRYTNNRVQSAKHRHCGLLIFGCQHRTQITALGISRDNRLGHLCYKNDTLSTVYMPFPSPIFPGRYHTRLDLMLPSDGLLTFIKHTKHFKIQLIHSTIIRLMIQISASKKTTF